MYQQNLTPALQALAINGSHLEKVLAQAQPAIAAFGAEVEGGQYPAFGSSLQLPTASVRAVESWSERFTHILILGMGGSSLGGKVIDAFIDPANLSNPRLHFLDHLDPTAMAQLLTSLPLEKTAFIAISKSGGTLETTTQVELFGNLFKRAGLSLARHALAVTEPTTNALRQWAEANEVPVLPHHPALGGRYSVFAETGTLPAVLKGLNVAALHMGASRTLKDWLHNPLGSAPALGAALHAEALRLGKTQNVVYTYGQRWRLLPFWLEQLWGESLGKQGQGTTVVPAAGPASQHSTQQLFLAGPANKLFTVILPHTHQAGPLRADGISTGTLQQAMGEGTVAALAARNQPVRVFTVADGGAENLGALLMHFMLETVLTACIWGLNPFDQPAVEESKQQSLQALARLKG